MCHVNVNIVICSYNMQLFYAFYNTCNKNFNGVYRLDKMFVSIFYYVYITQLEHEINSTHHVYKILNKAKQ